MHAWLIACQKTCNYRVWLWTCGNIVHMSAMHDACTLCRRSHEAARSLPLWSLFERLHRNGSPRRWLSNRKVLLPKRFRRLNSIAFTRSRACDETNTILRWWARFSQWMRASSTWLITLQKSSHKAFLRQGLRSRWFRRRSVEQLAWEGRGSSPPRWRATERRLQKDTWAGQRWW